ncbi:MAG: MBL fold metallo-hydrolase [Kiritimatiellae bacterium]|nr:MBL fold metallo-hydrolase [Kiritimatiellia bacterium]
MKFTSLASGSSGNAYCIESGGEALLIDCGISCRRLVRGCEDAGIDFSAISGIVFTHNHEDHISGLSTLHSRFPAIRLFANMMTAEAIASKTGVDEEDFSLFENLQRFDVGVFSVLPFSVPHDVPDPVGFLVSANGKTYFHATDVGTPLDSIGRHISEADIVTIESNHDPVLLAGSSRPESLKQRIRGQRGHLSNDDAAYLIGKFARPRLKKVFLAHLSGECNAPHIAEAAMAAALNTAGMANVPFETLSPDRFISFSC